MRETHSGEILPSDGAMSTLIRLLRLLLSSGWRATVMTALPPLHQSSQEDES